jgi:hypothetical protein
MLPQVFWQVGDQGGQGCEAGESSALSDGGQGFGQHLGFLLWRQVGGQVGQGAGAVVCIPDFPGGGQGLGQ